MKNRKFIIIGVVVLVITLLVVLLVRRERNVNTYDYPETLVVTNHTTHKNADTYSKIILNKIYDYDTITLNIYYEPKDYGSDEIEVAGFIQKNPFEPHHYNIFLNKAGLPISIKGFLSHELTHLHQMEIGDLVPLQDTLAMIYQGDTIWLLETTYPNRAYEINALDNQDAIYRELNQLLYRK